MGEPIEEYEEGINCPMCWGPDTVFGNYPTPLHVYITGDGFEGDEAVCNGKFVATQVGGIPCQWEFDDGTRYGVWFCGVDHTTFVMGITGLPHAFDVVVDRCEKIAFDGPKSVEIS